MTAAQDKPKVGRPSLYSEELTDEICERIATGQSLRTICAEEHMPDVTRVYSWLRGSDEFYHQYMRAREAQADYYADEIIEIADIETDAQRAKNRIDARKWHASKLAPKRYGDKVQLDGSVNVINDKSDMQIAREIAFLLEMGLKARETGPMLEAQDVASDEQSEDTE